MKIAKYVGDLLFDYECVVVPGLGGFLTSDKAASINSVSHHFKPPFRKVMFNVHLRANDGLLVNHIAQQEGVSYKSAKQKLDQFVHLCHTAIEDGKKVNFKGVGSIFKDKHNYIIFEQDESANYNPDAFGLSSFISPAVRRATEEEKIREFIKPEKSKKPVDRKTVEPISSPEPVRKGKMQATKKKSALQMQLTFIGFFILAAVVYYSYSHRHSMAYYWDQYSISIPAFYTSPNDFIEKNAGKIPASKISKFSAGFIPKTTSTSQDGASQTMPEAESTEITDHSSPTAILENSDNQLGKDGDPILDNEKSTSEEPLVIMDVDYVQIPKETIPETKDDVKELETAEPDDSKAEYNPPSTSGKFFIIAGSFKSENNARKLVEKLKHSGFDARIADTNKYGMFRVAFTSFSDEQAAENRLLAIRREHNGDAWILKK